MSYETAGVDSEFVTQCFKERGIEPLSVSVRSFPGETIFICEVVADDFQCAVSVAAEISDRLDGAFVTVRKGSVSEERALAAKVESLADPRITDLIELLNSRSRTSEHQPSLRYVQDVTSRLNVCTARRHNLIFGRRGVGKTALMLEAKSHVEKRGDATFWVNLQALRQVSADMAFLHVASRLSDLPATVFSNYKSLPKSIELARDIRSRAEKLLDLDKVKPERVGNLVPAIQAFVGLLNAESQRALYLFVDDFHYLRIDEQARFLDLLHGVTRDNNSYIKASGIKHQSRWFTDNPPVGLQTTHDAAIIDLDVTLENPSKAKEFLVDILQTYATEVHLKNTKAAFSGSAADRLVIASGGVPRDFLILCATTLQVARERAKARQAGVQDVNEAAGRVSQVKLTELEEDAASSGKSHAKIVLQSLASLRDFLLQRERATYFKVDFADKEQNPRLYAVLQSLMDLRLVHLISSSLSDERQAGRRYEVYALDLSQFSGARLRSKLKALDLIGGKLVLRTTGSNDAPKVGDSSHALLSILRRGPTMSLEILQAD
ncbi:ATP-binding protein [Marilutibacter aestuarii]|uniref:ATP-binding protein n=1 Tax=Marilutibacter aestuarii TaxID=1706195 RepID=A0A508A9E4_9GAMM|nr:ATP-binding protein [Lysobacter aestuarii]TQD46619.1 ATP-binding protein [Lysobacter aestuarii]